MMKVFSVMVCEMEGRKIVLNHFASVISYMLLAAFLTILKREIWDPGEGDSSAFPRMISF